MGKAELIIALLPVAERLIFSVGGKLVEMDTEKVTKDDLIKALEESKSENWPDLKFQSTAK